MMKFREKMIEKMCVDVKGSREVEVGEKVMKLKGGLKGVRMVDCMKELRGYEVSGMKEEEIGEVWKKVKMEIDERMGKGKVIEEMLGELWEGK